MHKGLLCFAALLAIVAGAAQQSAAPAKQPKQTLVEQALDYKKLTVIDKQPRKATDLSMAFCRNVDGTLTPHEFVQGSKVDAMLKVYADSASVALVSKAKKDSVEFPVGSIFVKEKFLGKSTKTPHLLTAMKKVKPGRGADKWSYEMIDIKTRKPTKPVRSAPTCVQCHTNYTASDGISTETFKLMKGKK